LLSASFVFYRGTLKAFVSFSFLAAVDLVYFLIGLALFMGSENRGRSGSKTSLSKIMERVEQFDLNSRQQISKESLVQL
jgi:hypothetical protein